MSKKNIKSFTLIEIIVVLIILGILASIALPNLYSWVHKCNAAEAFMNLKQVRDRLELCFQNESNWSNGNHPACAYFLASASPPDYFYTTSNNFGYQVTFDWGGGPGLHTFTIYAYPIPLSPFSYIRFRRTDGPNGTWSCYSSGDYSGLC